MKASTLKTLVQAKEQGHAVVLATSLENHSQLVFFPETTETDGPLGVAVRDGFRTDRSRVIEFEGKRHFIQVINQPLKLFVVGAVHIAQALIPMAQSCGYAVTLIDPRKAFASNDRFPGVAVRNEWPDKALTELGLNSRTAVVTLTHDPKLDEPALVKALNSDVFYIGALGSRRTHQARCERLSEAGVSEEKLERIHAPIGMDIGATSPAEIAISIMGEITSALRMRVNR